jgi:hypothetical protein
MAVPCRSTLIIIWPFVSHHHLAVQLSSSFGLAFLIIIWPHHHLAALSVSHHHLAY